MRVATTSEGFYTIQAGVYTPASLEYAKKHFNMLAGKLREDERDNLRIEQAGKYFIVRIGKFQDAAEAARLLEKVKILVRDAFIIKENNFDTLHVVKLYEKNSTPPEKKTLPVAGEAKVPKLEEYYTLQIKRLSGIEQATKAFDALKGKLNESDLDCLRIEKIGNSFSLRLGKFETYSLIKEFLARIIESIPDAVIMKEKSADEQVVKIYGEQSSNLLIIGSMPADKKTGKTKSPETLDEPKKKELELFLNDVSTNYSDAQYGKAAELLRKGIAKWPDNPDLYAWYGATLLNMRYPENALKQYRKASELSPDVPDYHAGAGLSLMNIYMDKAKESMDAFKKALEIDPQNVAALEGLGFLYVSLGKKDLAVEIHNRLEQLDKAAAERLNQAMEQGIDLETR